MIRNFIFLAIMAVSFVTCKSPEARRPVKSSSGTFILESAERNKKIIEDEENLIAAIMKANPQNSYFASENGFWYFYNVMDTLSLITPVIGDEVTFTYNIKKLDGTSILSEEENGLQSYKIDQSNQELISGLRDGLKLMKEGEQITFLFPSHKAYGYYGIEKKLGTNVPIQSTVTLKSIEQQEN